MYSYDHRSTSLVMNMLNEGGVTCRAISGRPVSIPREIVALHTVDAQNELTKSERSCVCVCCMWPSIRLYFINDKCIFE